MDLGLKDKVVVITGGGTGIGFAAALEFAREGARVAICGRTTQKLKDAAAQFEQLGFDLYTKTCDVTLSNEVKAFADAVTKDLGLIDIWVNNAGSNQIKSLVEYDDEEMEMLIGINLKSFIICSNIAAKAMKGRGGVIINASSFSALIPNAGRGVYSACKSAVLNLTRTYAAELAAEHIRVVAYIPGQIVTALTIKVLQSIGKEKLISNIPMRRLGTPEDLAKPIVFLASDAAAYINGCALEVSGAKFCVQNPGYSWENN